MLHIEINGQRLTGRVDGLQSFSLTKARSEDHLREEISFSGELKFYDDGYNILFPLLVASPTGVSASVQVSIFDDCCNKKFDGFIITGDMVDWCTGDCFVKTRLRFIDKDQSIRDLFNSTSISDNRNGFFTNGKFPKMVYCNELRPVWLHIVILILGSIAAMVIDIILGTVYAILEIVLDFVIGVCRFLNKLISFIDDVYDWMVKMSKKIKKYTAGIINISVKPKPILKDDVVGCAKVDTLKKKWQKELNDIMVGLNENLIGCGCSHPSPLIRDYIQNANTICGVTGFVSTVFNNPANEFYNTVYFYSPTKRGRKPNVVGNYIMDNAPKSTVSEWLDQICAAANCEWWIDNAVLYIEREDSWLTSSVLYDSTQHLTDGNIIEGPCFTYNEGKQYNRLSVGYTLDPIDICGNEEMDQYELRDTDQTVGVNFGKRYGYNAVWKDNKDIFIPFAPVKFRSSSLDDVLTFSMLIFPTIPIFFGKQINGTNDHLLMEQNHCSVPKLLIWDGKDYNRGIVKDYGGSKDRNYPWQIRDAATNPPTQNGSLYDYFQIFDPVSNPYRFWKYSLKVKADCIQINDLNLNKTVRIMMPWGQTKNARINSLTLTYGNSEGTTLEIEGEI